MSSDSFSVPGTYKRCKLTMDNTAASQHLRLINQPPPREKNVSFTLFPNLSIEIRLRIWEFAIVRRRMLEIEVEASENGNEDGHNYTITAHGSQIHHKLFRVSRESRGVALRFYRVHIPCTFRDLSEEEHQITKSLMYMNPEHDIFNIRANPDAGSAIAALFHDLQANDPQSTGLLSLALDINSMNALASIPADSLSTIVHTSFTHALTHLSKIIYVASSSIGRGTIGPLIGNPSAGVRFNHSMPIKSDSPAFELLSRDPRPVDTDLEHIITASIHPFILRTKWQELLQRFSIHQSEPTTERVLIACQPAPSTFDKRITTYKTAVEFLDVEERRWLQAQRKWHTIVERVAGKVPCENGDELAKAVRPAIGFWLFPVEAMQKMRWDPKLVADLRGFIPELALAYLP